MRGSTREGIGGTWRAYGVLWAAELLGPQLSLAKGGSAGDHTVSQNATRRAEGQCMAQYLFWVKTQVAHGVYNGSSARAGSEARPGRERRNRSPVPSTGQNTVLPAHFG